MRLPFKSSVSSVLTLVLTMLLIFIMIGYLIGKCTRSIVMKSIHAGYEQVTAGLVLANASSNPLDKEGFIFYLPTSGLANSMLGLMSTFILSKYIEKTLVVTWMNNINTNCELGYEEIRNLGAAKEVLLLKDSCSVKMAAFQACGLQLNQHSDPSVFEYLYRSDLQVLKNCRNVIVSSNQYFGSLLLQNPRINVRPLDIHAEELIAFHYLYDIPRAKKRDQNYCISVHMRSFLGSNAEKLMQCAARWSAITNCSKSHGIYLAADTTDALQDMLRICRQRSYSCYFQNKNHTIKDSEGSSSRSISSVRDAYVDLVALGSAKICIGTSQLSTFSEISRSLFNCTKVDESNGCEVVPKEVRPHVPDKYILGKFEPKSGDQLQSIVENSVEQGTQLLRSKVAEIFARYCTG